MQASNTLVRSATRISRHYNAAAVLATPARVYSTATAQRQPNCRPIQMEAARADPTENNSQTKKESAAAAAAADAFQTEMKLIVLTMTTGLALATVYEKYVRQAEGQQSSKSYGQLPACL